MQERFEVFTVSIAQINRNIRKIKTEEMAEFNLKSVHVSCLYYIYKNKSLTAKELCDVCDEDKASISRSVDYLEKNGFLTCDERGKKRYRSPFSLSSKGRETGKRIAEKIDRILDMASNGLSEENRIIFYQSLALINENLQSICTTYGKEIKGE